MNIVSINPENPFTDLIQPDGSDDLISDSQELDNVEPLDQQPLTTGDTLNINRRLQDLENNIKLDIVLPSGEVLEGKTPKTPRSPKSSRNLKPAPDSVPTEIINIPDITPNYSETLKPFLVQKRILGTKHRDVPEKLYVAIIDGKDEYPAVIPPEIPDISQTKSHAEIAIKALDIETRFGKPILASTRKKYTKEELAEVRAERQRQRELFYEEEPDIEITSENEDYITPELISGLKEAKNIKASQMIPKRLISQPQYLREYKNTSSQKSLVKPIMTQQKIEINLPEYQTLTLENGMIPEIGESEDEFKFRSYWTQIAMAIAENLSVGTIISLGKMKRQKIIWGVTFNPQMEELIKTVDSVYILNPMEM